VTDRVFLKGAMIALEQLYAHVEEQYLGSNDFNGLPLGDIEGVTLAEARPVIRSGVELEYFQVEVSNNPHIKITALMNKSSQLAWLDSDQFSTFSSWSRMRTVFMCFIRDIPICLIRNNCTSICD